MNWFRSRRVVLFLAACIGASICATCTPSFSQDSTPDPDMQVMHHLNQVLRWYRQWESADAFLSRPGNEVYVENGRAIAQQVMRLEFQAALAQAALIGSSSTRPHSANALSGTQVDARKIIQTRQRVEQQLQALQTQLDVLNGKIAGARAKERPVLISQRDTLRNRLQLAQALQASLQKLSSFTATAEASAESATELTARIIALQRTVPGALTTAGTAKESGKQASDFPSSVPTPAASRSQASGLFSQVGQLVRLMGSLRSLRRLKEDSTRLQSSTRQLRAPLIAALRNTLQEGQLELEHGGQLATANPNSDADTSGAPAAAHPGNTTPATAQTQPQVAGLVQRFNHLSDAVVPLSQEIVLVDQSRANLNQLQASIQHDYISILRSLLIRVVMLLIALGVIWLFSELWRRASFRYISDARRRRQFLLMRRVATGFCMFVVVVLGLISNFSSLATYAGLITAGIAVALQAVILSIAAYFFLVGRYGVKVGDRITVVYNGPNSVAGDVMDIGLVRFYMKELAGSGIDMQPTGRIVVLPNSVLFQTNPLFKQLPGTEYAWREIALPLHPECDAKLAEKELLAVAERMYAGYLPVLESQQPTIESMMGIHIDVPRPYTRLRFVPSGLEVMVRYPIPLRQAAVLDDRMVMETTEILKHNPSIRLADGGVPELRSPVKV